MKRSMFEEVRKNKFTSSLLMALFVIIIGVLGAVIGLLYNNMYLGLFLAVGIGVIYSFVMYRRGSDMVLALSGARPVTKKEYPYLFHTIEGLAIAAGIPIPKAYVIEDTALNAFATGRDPEHAAIAVTTGLLDRMNRQELEGVVAHEMAHIKNFDVRFMLMVTVFIGITTLLADFLLRSFLWGGKSRRSKKDGGQVAVILIVVGLVFAILTPIIVQFIRFAISRKKEFAADAQAAILTRYPPGLAGALKKIKQDPDPLVDHANRATSHLFISTPFRKSTFSNLFATHPPIDERIKRLEAM